MKKINILLLFLAGLFLVISCEKDIDSNPTLKQPTDFILNTPDYASSILILEQSDTIAFTCTQADYGFTAAAVYSIQVSLNSDMSDSIQLSTTYTSAKMMVPASEFSVAVATLLGLVDESDVPEDPINVYIRAKSTLSNTSVEVADPVFSNIITLEKVKAYFALEEVTLPEEMYFIGNICDWNWSNAIEMVPVYGTEGQFWAMVDLNQVDGANAEIKFNTATSWDDNQFGMSATISDESVTLAGVSGDDNIVIENPGWYIVLVTTTLNGREYDYSVDFYEPNVYLMGNANGGTWSCEETFLFTVPAAGETEFISPAFTGTAAGDSDGGVRACISLPSHEWWHSEFMIFDGVLEYRGNGGDQSRVSGSVGQKLYIDFTNGTGKIE